MCITYQPILVHIYYITCKIWIPVRYYGKLLYVFIYIFIYLYIYTYKYMQLCAIKSYWTTYFTKIHTSQNPKYKQSHSITVLTKPLRLPELIHNQHINVAKSASRTGHIYPQEIFLVLIPLSSWVDHRATVSSEGLSQRKIPYYPTGNGTRNLPACSAVRQPTALPYVCVCVCVCVCIYTYI
jgi:hypothetical protein